MGVRKVFKCLKKVPGKFFTFQASGNFSPVLGTSFSSIICGGLTGCGKTGGYSGGISGGFSLIGCFTWGLREIDCNRL